MEGIPQSMTVDHARAVDGFVKCFSHCRPFRVFRDVINAFPHVSIITTVPKLKRGKIQKTRNMQQKMNLD